MLSKIAVTGGLSCGKSTFCRFLKELGAKVVNSDEIVHQLLHPQHKIGQEVIKLLGNEIVRNNDQIDRSLIAKKVFNHPEQLKSLEAILHPAVMEEIDRLYEEQKRTAAESLFVAEIPLLFEINRDKDFQKTIVVASSKENSKDRFKKSTGKDDYDERMTYQLPIEEKIKRADYVIYNNGSLSDLYNAAKTLYNQITHHTQ